MGVRKSVFCMVLCVLVFCGLSRGSSSDYVGDKLPAMEPHLASLVWVEYGLQYADGDAPEGIGWGEVCPNCGNIHGNQLEERMRSERMIRAPGFKVGEGLVLTPDFWVEERFIRSAEVVSSDGDRYAARIHAHRDDGPGMLLAVDEDTDIPTLSFGGEPDGPFLSLRKAFLNGQEQTQLSHVSQSPVTVLSDKRSFVTVPGSSLITDESGNPVGVSLSGELDDAKTWQGNPLDAAWRGADDLREAENRLAGIADKGLVMVSMSFRSPPAEPGQHAGISSSFHFSRGRHGQAVDENTTEHHAPGLLVAADQVLVLAGLPYGLLTRLDRVEVQTGDGTKVNASFSGAFRDYHAFLVSLSEPLEGALSLADAPIHTYRNQLLMGVDLHLEPSVREVRMRPIRFEALEESFANQTVPSFVNISPQMFVFAGEKLLVMPMQRRDLARVLQAGRFHSASMYHQPLSYWQEILADPADYFDATLRPLDDVASRKVAWIGVELQQMDRELALAHGVLRRTENGQRGALVTHVYSDSPGAEAGLQNGDILLWAEADGVTAPIPVRIDASAHGRFPFQWEMLDHMPAQHFEQMPPPWPAVRSPFNRMLTQLGEGRSVRFKLVRDGESQYMDFELEMSPSSYATAERHQDENTGITVRDFTFEVRNFLQAGSDDPGVVVARVESGGKGWVAGIRPYELITHINGEPVHSVAAFEEKMQETGDKQLTIKRMAATRLAHIAGE